MSEIKKIPDSDLLKFLEIANNAYPGYNANTPEVKERFLTRYKEIQNSSSSESIYGLYRDNQLLGGMIIYDYKMNMLNNMINATGIGNVAVDFLHKKEKVAKEMLHYFLKYCSDHNSNVALLYPFRPDFYKKMGFGYGPKINHYVIKPEHFPKKLNHNLTFLDKNDSNEITNCYKKVFKDTHGMIDISEEEVIKLFKNPRLRIAGFKKNNKIEGYIVFTFKGESSNFLINDMIIHRFVYHTNEALLNISAFLNTQQDQIRNIIINTFDDSFHHFLHDPRNNSTNIIPSVYHESNTQGVGLMYRVINVEGLFKDFNQHNFNNVNVKIKIKIEDDFLKENKKEVIIHFINGYPKITQEDYDVEIQLSIADFSSLIMGVIQFKTLYNYSLVHLSNITYLNTLNELFKVDSKPICMTDF